ncbi:hypothetical protein EST38_g4144 [Candolleomyces aberdarensis]|uniref:NADP-dependent oxidoreductase domain-containing protein n=1 Tax=Candolleomyces aberdarensis TaxID=2316362 RepID=A0A4Q2DRQ4_9AGAR|nr:hypothetical protein EST38_g4144 [Candolleomyces aberdarensis]
MFAPQPPPKSRLGVYRQLSPNAGVHLSPLCFGGGTIGDRWHEKFGVGYMDKESSFKILDTFFEMGGNFIDTANSYQDGRSEEFIGEWAEARRIRDQVFIATKYASNPHLHSDDESIKQKILYAGTSVKSMHISVEASLKKLRTSYIDLFYVHYWDYTTSIQEVMHALHALVMARKVLYLGISDAPAWVVSQANQYARDHALTPFSVYQGQWNVMDRSFERDIIPMARNQGSIVFSIPPSLYLSPFDPTNKHPLHFSPCPAAFDVAIIGMALAPWGVLAGGKIRSDEEEERRRQTGEKGRTFVSPSWERTESEKKVCDALEVVKKEVGAENITAVAIAYLLHKTPYVFPIVGLRKPEQLQQNIEALEISLTKDHLKFLDGVVPFEAGFPHNILGDGTEYDPFTMASGEREKWPVAGVLTGRKLPKP